MIPNAFGLRGLAIGALVAGSFGAWGGWTAKATVERAKQADLMEKQRVEHQAQLALLQRDLDESAAERIRLASALDFAEANTRTVTREIIKEVPRYAPTSTPECDYSLSPGLIGLHNAAANGTALGPARAEDASGELSGGMSASEYPRD
jgi:hypothetical protein